MSEIVELKRSAKFGSAGKKTSIATGARAETKIKVNITRFIVRASLNKRFFKMFAKSENANLIMLY